MKTKIDIFSGFIGAGKTTLIKKLLREAYPGERLIVVQNENGEVQFAQEDFSGREFSLEGINSGCICCDSSASFISSIRTIVEWTQPDRILLEPSGVGRLTDIIRMLEGACGNYLEISGIAVAADARKIDLYLRNYRGFYDDQLKNALCVMLSRCSDAQYDAAAEKIHRVNPEARVFGGDWAEADAEEIVRCMKCR